MPFRDSVSQSFSSLCLRSYRREYIFCMMDTHIPYHDFLSPSLNTTASMTQSSPTHTFLPPFLHAPPSHKPYDNHHAPSLRPDRLLRGDIQRCPPRDVPLCIAWLSLFTVFILFVGFSRWPAINTAPRVSTTRLLTEMQFLCLDKSSNQILVAKEIQ